MHDSAYEYVRSFYENRFPEVHRGFLRVVEFGSRDVNGNIRGIFRSEDFWGVDIADGPGVDQVIDASEYIGESPADIIVCCETLEHTPEVRAIVANAYQNLGFGGYFVVTCATHPRLPHSAVDGGLLRPGEYYGNVAPRELALHAEEVGFEVIDIHTKMLKNHGGDLYMVARKET